MKIWDLIKAAGFIVCIALLVFWFEDESWEQLDASVKVVDGDSLSFGKTRLRLVGIDAPEFQQTCLRDGRAVKCGVLAKQHLEQLTGNGAVSCADHGTDKHGRTLAVCRMTDSDDPVNGSLISAGTQSTINAQMVHDGWAVSYGDYKALEVLAALAGRGLWALEFEKPEDWRRIHAGDY